jgi:acyl-CoA thioester hydrolase
MKVPDKDPFEASYRVTWADLDANGHMANSAYLDYATDTRFRHAGSRGFSPADLRRLGIGPVIFEDRLTYRRELLFLDEFVVTHGYTSVDPQYRKFVVRNVFLRRGEPVAEVEAQGAWMDLATRKVTPPPPEVIRAFSA